MSAPFPALCEALGLEIVALPPRSEAHTRRSWRARRSVRGGWTAGLAHAVSSPHGCSAPRAVTRAGRSGALGAVVDRWERDGLVQRSLRVALGGRCSQARVGTRGASLLEPGEPAIARLQKTTWSFAFVVPRSRREDLGRLFARARELCGNRLRRSRKPGRAALLSMCRPHGGVAGRRRVHQERSRADLRPVRGARARQCLRGGTRLLPRSDLAPSGDASFGLEERLTRIGLGPELAAWFLEPNDAAVSKYARMEPRDREWIRPGLRAGVLSIAILEARFADTPFLDQEESRRARKAFDEDRRWLRSPRARRSRR